MQSQVQNKNILLFISLVLLEVILMGTSGKEHYKIKPENFPSPESLGSLRPFHLPLLPLLCSLNIKKKNQESNK